MQMMVSEFGGENVKLEIVISIQKCSVGLGIQMSEMQMSILADDLMDVYKLDSVEDIIQCLKKGRSGKYGFGHNSRQSLNMMVLREWMAKHLDEKGEAREKELSKHKDHNDDDLGLVDYEAYKSRILEEKKKPKPKSEIYFEALKAEYFESKNKKL